MKTATMLKQLGASAILFFAFSVAAPAQAPGMAVLNDLQKGMWTLKPRGSSEPGKKVCLGDPISLIQIQHGSANCSRYIIENQPDNLRVSYKCGNLGGGVTTYQTRV